MEFRVTYRKIAITMVKHLPVYNDEDFSNKVEYYTGLLERLPRHCRSALKAAYVIASKAPPDDREDCFQDYYLAAHKALTRIGDKVRNPEAFAYTAVIGKRRDNFVYLNALKRRNGGLVSLSRPSMGVDGNQIELSETISDQNAFIDNIESVYDAKRIWQILPQDIKHIVLKRLNGQAVSPTERKKLSRWNQVNGNNILEVIKS